MDLISKKDKIKDYLILSLIDTVAELYSINYNIESDIIKNHILNKLDEYNILDVDINKTNMLEVKSKIMTLITKDLPKNIIQNNISLFDNYKKCELIGSGGYAHVYEVYNSLDDRKYAIKKIGIRNNFYPSLIEVRSMAKLEHKNIVRYHTSWVESININKKIDNLNSKLLCLNQNMEKIHLVKVDSTELIKAENSEYDDSYSTENSEYDEKVYDKFIFIQMELCKQNLRDYLLNNKLDDENKKIICREIIEGLTYIHNNNIIHRDLKPTNIFIDFDNKIKIGDFGLATNIYDMHYEEVGTGGYITPEILNGEKYNAKADLYSLGVIILEIFGNFKTNMEKLLILRKIRHEKNCTYLNNNELNKIISSLLCKDPNKRGDLDNILNKFITDS